MATALQLKPNTLGAPGRYASKSSLAVMSPMLPFAVQRAALCHGVMIEWRSGDVWQVETCDYHRKG